MAVNFNYGPLAIGVAIPYKLVGYAALVEIHFTDATDHILFVAMGSSVNGADHSEITDQDGNNVTRFTASGTGVQRIQINGLTPGAYLSMGEVSGSSTTAPKMYVTTG